MAGIAETAKLMSELNLKDNFTPAANKAMKSLGRLESTGFRIGQNIGKGINNAAKNIKKIATVGVAALAGAVALGVRSLADLQRTQNQTDAAIQSTGGKAKVTATQVRDLATSLEDLSTVDDKVIQDGENLLLTFTNISKDTFPAATKAALDMALALANGNVEQVDLNGSAIKLGKALNDPAKGYTALKKAGVAFTAAQIKQLKASGGLSKEEAKHYASLLKTNKVEAKRYMATTLANKRLAAQKLILKELNTEFGKSSEAAGKGPEAVMRRLADAGENVSQILARATLPVLERLGKFLTDKLNDKRFLAAVDAFGIQLGIAGGKFLDFLEKVDFGAIAGALQTGAKFAGEIIGAFLKAPTWLQEAIVTGWGLNKLTGGAVTGIFGELASGLIKGVLGMTAGVVNINAGVVNGGLGGINPGTVAGAAGAAAGGVTIAAISVVAAAALASAFAFSQTAHGPKAGPGAFTPTVGSAFAPPTVKVQGFSGIDWGTIARNLGKAPQNPPKGRDDPTDVQRQFGPKIEKTTASVDSLKGKIADDLDATKNALAAASGKTTTATTNAGSYVGRTVQAGAAVVASAVRSSQPIVNTYVNVSSTTVDKTTTVIKRYGSIGGDRVQGGSGVTHNGAD